MDSEYKIESVNFSSVNLNRIRDLFPGDYASISGYIKKFETGLETSKDLLELASLLSKVGEKEEAEYLLRHNMQSKREFDVYVDLFGGNVFAEFRRAIDQFFRQHGVKKINFKRNYFLDETYRLDVLKSPSIKIMEESCEARFTYTDREFVELDLSSLDSEKYTLLYWSEDVGWSVKEVRPRP